MRCKYIVLAACSALLAGGVSSKADAQIQDGVYIDYSVLDGLQKSDSPVITTQPLFPQVKKSIPAKKLKPAAKKAHKAVKPAVKKVNKPAPKVKPLSESEQIAASEAKDAEEKAKLAAAEKEVLTEEVYDVKEDDDKTSALDDKVIIPSAIPDVQIPVAEDKAPLSEENLSAEIKAEPVSENELGYTPINNLPAAPAVNVIDTTISEPAQAVTPVQGAVLPAEESLLQEVKPAENLDVVPAENVIAAEPQVMEEVKTEQPMAPLVEAKASVVVNQVYFEDEAAPLSDANKQKIDEIIASFENANDNKIAILSYNLDDGQDVFKKKRLSLNRAIEIRKYLLDKGYKNFSIKVVNVVDEPVKKNLIEIDEIK